MSFQVCWGGLMLLNEFDEKLVYPWIRDSCRKGHRCFSSASSLELTLQKKRTKKWYVWCFQLAASWRRGDDKNRPRPCNTLTVLSQELFPSDLSMGELSDTSSALLTRRYRSLIEVGLSLPSSPMILFSMGQWEVGGSPWRTRHW